MVNRSTGDQREVTGSKVTVDDRAVLPITLRQRAARPSPSGSRYGLAGEPVKNPLLPGDGSAGLGTGYPAPGEID